MSEGGTAISAQIPPKNAAESAGSIGNLFRSNENRRMKAGFRQSPRES
jgi:hypothetical protein